MVTFRLKRIDQTTADIAELDGRIDQLIAQHGYTATPDLLQSIPGLGKHGAEELLAELGADMTVGVLGGGCARVARVGWGEETRQDPAWEPLPRQRPLQQTPPQRTLRRKIKDLEAAGYNVTKAG